VAHKYKAARILAVDLSLSSLCYVKRKTPAGATKIEYAQAFCRNGGFDPAFNCFDGSGAGRIYGDGLVNGHHPVPRRRERTVALPAGTLRVRSEAVCASLQGIPFEPCFHVEKTDHRSLRGSHEHCRYEPAVAFARAALSALITYPFHAPAPRDSAKASGGFAEAFAPDSDAGLMNQESEYNPASGRAR